MLILWSEWHRSNKHEMKYQWNAAALTNRPSFLFQLSNAEKWSKKDKQFVTMMHNSNTNTGTMTKTIQVQCQHMCNANTSTTAMQGQRQHQQKYNTNGCCARIPRHSPHVDNLAWWGDILKRACFWASHFGYFKAILREVRLEHVYCQRSTLASSKRPSFN